MEKRLLYPTQLVCNSLASSFVFTSGPSLSRMLKYTVSPMRAGPGDQVLVEGAFLFGSNPQDGVA